MVSLRIGFSLAPNGTPHWMEKSLRFSVFQAGSTHRESTALQQESSAEGFYLGRADASSVPPPPSFPPILSGHARLPDSYAITTAQDLRATSVSRLVTSVCGHLQHGPRVATYAKDADTTTLRRQPE